MDVEKKVNRRISDL